MILFLAYITALASAWFWEKGKKHNKNLLLNTAIFWMVGGCFYVIFSRLVYVNNYPFPLYWSEGNRFFDYSTLFGSFRYITPNGKGIYAFINWGMQLPWALPFIFPNLSITAFRLWYQLVWIIPAILLGISAFNNFYKGNRSFILPIIFGVWALLFTNQGPIYAPLIIAAILVMIGMRMRLFPAILMVMLASFYASQSRWTWSYAPGLWAGLSALLTIDKPAFSKKKLKENFRPVLLGVSGLFGGRVLPDLFPVFSSIIKEIGQSGVVDSQAAPLLNGQITILPDITRAATRQPLLWDRLLPNSTYPPGILLGIIWATLPLIIALVYLAIKKHWQVNWLQVTSMLAISLAFLIVGITASVKIGGGSNLHNLDMFLITLVIIFASTAGEIWGKGLHAAKPVFLITTLIAFALSSPVSYALGTTEKPLVPEKNAIQESLDMIRKKLEAVDPSEEVLFIDHRQLLTFNLVQKVPLVDKYEKKKLMNEAMGANEAYFEPFYSDISKHRFALIINEPLNIVERGEDYAFGDENDAFVKWVTTPLFCAYEPIYTNHETAVELLVPRISPPPEHLDCNHLNLK
jgi:hypothetical protein